MDRHYNLCQKCGQPKKKTAELCRKCKPVSYQRTPEHNQLMSERTKGIRHDWLSASTRPEIADKIRQAWTPEKREVARKMGIERSLDPEWRAKCGQPGELNPMWEDGRSVIPYTPGWSRKVKQLAWQRANHHCEICGSDKPRDTHHKDFRKDNHDLNNLQVLCRKCHKALHVAHLKS